MRTFVFLSIMSVYRILYIYRYFWIVQFNLMYFIDYFWQYGFFSLNWMLDFCVAAHYKLVWLLQFNRSPLQTSLFFGSFNLILYIWLFLAGWFLFVELNAVWLLQCNKSSLQTSLFFWLVQINFMYFIDYFWQDGFFSFTHSLFRICFSRWIHIRYISAYIPWTCSFCKPSTGNPVENTDTEVECTYT